jgi:hypothetical protein
MSSLFRTSSHVPFAFSLAVVDFRCVIVDARTVQLRAEPSGRVRMTHTRTRIATLCFAALAASCSGRSASPSSAPIAPSAPSTPSSPSGPGPTSGTYRVTGRVVERSPEGLRPVSDAGVNLWVDAGNYGYSYWWANGQVHSGGDGTFQMPNLPAAAGWAQAWKDGYLQQCAVPLPSLSTNPAVEVALVARGNLLVDPASVSPSVPGRIVSGRILQSDSSDPRPAAGAFVNYEPVMEVPAAATYSDSDGRYLLCGVADGTISVWSGTQPVYVAVPRDQGLNVHLDITVPN